MRATMSLGKEGIFMFGAGHTGTKGDSVGHNAGVGAAAHRVRLVLAAGDLGVKLLKGNNARIILGHVEGRGHIVLYNLPAMLRPVSAKTAFQRVLILRDSIAAVYADLQGAVLQVRNAVNQCGITGGLIVIGNTLADAKAILSQMVQLVNSRLSWLV